MNAEKVIKKSLFHILLVFIVFAFLFPIIWQALVSVKPPLDIVSPKLILFFKPTFINWKYILKENLFHNLKNSVIVTSLGVLLSILLGSAAAYAFARFEFRAKSFWQFNILTLRMLPPIIPLIPIFILMKTIKMLNTYFALTVTYVSFNLPFVIWLMISFFKEVPLEIEDAARVDGCSWWEVYWKISFPLVKMGVIATSILTAMYMWNEFMMAVILTGKDTGTLAVAAAGTCAHFTVNWGNVAVVSVFTISPMILFGILVQKHIVRGLTLGAIK